MPHSIRELVDRQVARWYAEKAQLDEQTLLDTAIPRPVITISRQLGSGGAEVAKRVAQRMDCELIGWSIVDAIVKKSEVRKELVDKMDERTRSRIDAWLDGVRAGQTFDEGDYTHYLLDTIRSFMELGSVVVLGRGAGFVPTDRPRVNVRVVAPMEHRVETVVKREKCGRNEAVAIINESDLSRAKFIKKLFDAEWEDPLQYDLVINLAHIPLSCAEAIIETAWLRYATDFDIRKR